MNTRHNLKATLILTLALALATTAGAEDSIPAARQQPPFSVGLEIATKYIWRGLDYGNAPSTVAVIKYEHKGFSVDVTGLYEMRGDYSEIDVAAHYTHRWLTLTLNEQYNPTAPGQKDHYFQFSNHRTGHYLELLATIQPEHLPLWLMVSNYFWGADKRPDTDRQAYSTYAELGFFHTFGQWGTASIAVGAATANSLYNNYEHGFGVVNVAAKYATSFRFGKFHLPVSASYVINPQRAKSYVTLSVFFNTRF